MSQPAVHSAPAVSSGSENCLPLGTRLAEFEIKGIIGEGGFGIVYLAFDHSLQRTVAIKEYMPAVLAARTEDNSVTVRAKQHQETFEKGLKSFINEARLLAQFDHPALIKVYRFWEQNSTGYMAMRYYEGRTLKNIVSEDPSVINEAWLKSILAPVLEALDALYRSNILHRDISPDNIMVQNSGEAVLLDFGAARQIISNITQSLTVILKPGYAPVEQYADDDSMTQGPWTDIYSLSAVIYFAIMKKPPATSVGRMIKDPIEPLQNGEHKGFGKPFLAAIDKGLGIRPEERPQTIDEFRRLLGIDSDVKIEVAPLKPARPASTPAPASSARRHGDRNERRRSHDKQPVAKAVPKAYKWLWIGGVLLFASMIALGVARKKSAESPVISVAPAPVQAAPAVDTESVDWEALLAKSDVSKADVEAYLAKYPAGKNTEAAKTKLAFLEAVSPKAESASASADAKPVEPEKLMGTVKLIIKPWGNVSVDGVAKGVSPPLKRLVLLEGKHKVKIENPNFPAHVFEVDVSTKKPVNLEYDFASHKP